MERNFEKIGEALKRLQRHDPELARRVPDAPQITNFRNVLSHEYDSVNQGIVW